MDNDKVRIVFDKDYKIRVMDPTRFSQAEELDKECGDFVGSTTCITFLSHELIYSIINETQRFYLLVTKYLV